MNALPFRLGLLTVLVLPAFSSLAGSTEYDLSFVASSPDGTVANGQLDVANGLAVAGYLDVTAGPEAGDYTLVTGSGGDANFDYDNIIFPSSANGFVDTTAGLLWSVSGTAGNSEELNMWFNPTPAYGAPGDSYSLWGADAVWNLESYGSATLDLPPKVSTGAFHLIAAPDASQTLLLLGGAMGGLMLAQARQFPFVRASSRPFSSCGRVR